MKVDYKEKISFITKLFGSYLAAFEAVPSLKVKFWEENKWMIVWEKNEQALVRFYPVPNFQPVVIQPIPIEVD